MNLDTVIHSLLIGADDAGAAVLFGSSDLTISSRVGMALSDYECGTYSPDGPHGIREASMLLLARGLDDLQKQHCMESWIGDRDRAKAILADLEPYLLRAYAKGITV